MTGAGVTGGAGWAVAGCGVAGCGVGCGAGVQPIAVVPPARISA